MKDIFNTTFEISLRILMVLKSSPIYMSLDRIVAFDFITTYSYDFGIGGKNLHGNNNYNFSEYAIKRKIVSEAIKKTVLTGYVTPKYGRGGFTYTISKDGALFCESLNNAYIKQYEYIVKQVDLKFSDYSDRNLVHLINSHAISKLGGTN